MSDDAKIDKLLRQVQRENLHPDAGVRAELKVERLQAELAELRERLAERERLTRQSSAALAAMVEALAAEVRAK